MYTDEPGRPYYFWRGINPAALLALAAGCCTYVVLLNPLTYESRGLYAYLTASGCRRWRRRLWYISW